MPLLMLDQDPASLPVIYCDACGKPITSLADGNYHWGTEPFDPDHPVVKQPIYFSHKSNCALRVDSKFGTDSCMDLEDLLLLLIKTLDFDLKKARSRRALLEAIG